ncbi:hypothetical protein CROQUDRAFT_94757 [Cronartium quercuum f. sp. fusiforme G11]|uniref:Uncharacterized protein n=1 Tax=Cronartium quercuum f. sp. fusiforme G11 TaxID=708437 RepID=A0A9P6NES7_9BASI|nr:hypothetical protein CROQUDRAFT_94757 [Cronartium quercuum f. sp. fusiforme G11]
MHVTGLSSNGPRNLYTLHDPDLPGVFGLGIRKLTRKGAPVEISLKKFNDFATSAIFVKANADAVFHEKPSWLNYLNQPKARDPFEACVSFKQPGSGVLRSIILRNLMLSRLTHSCSRVIRGGTPTNSEPNLRLLVYQFIAASELNSYNQLSIPLHTISSDLYNPLTCRAMVHLKITLFFVLCSTYVAFGLAKPSPQRYGIERNPKPEKRLPTYQTTPIKRGEPGSPHPYPASVKQQPNPGNPNPSPGNPKPSPGNPNPNPVMHQPREVKLEPKEFKSGSKEVN